LPVLMMSIILLFLLVDTVFNSPIICKRTLTSDCDRH